MACVSREDRTPLPGPSLDPLRSCCDRVWALWRSTSVDWVFGCVGHWECGGLGGSCGDGGFRVLGGHRFHEVAEMCQGHHRQVLAGSIDGVLVTTVFIFVVFWMRVWRDLWSRGVCGIRSCGNGVGVVFCAVFCFCFCFVRGFECPKLC